LSHTTKAQSVALISISLASPSARHRLTLLVPVLPG